MQNTGGYSHSSFENGNIGPNIYQVNDQVIKPMTADPSLILPGVSWALSDCLAGHSVTHFVSNLPGRRVCLSSVACFFNNGWKLKAPVPTFVSFPILKTWILRVS